MPTDMEVCPCFECGEFEMNGGECDGSELNCVDLDRYNTYEDIS